MRENDYRIGGHVTWAYRAAGSSVIDYWIHDAGVIHQITEDGTLLVTQANGGTLAVERRYVDSYLPPDDEQPDPMTEGSNNEPCVDCPVCSGRASMSYEGANQAGIRQWRCQLCGYTEEDADKRESNDGTPDALRGFLSDEWEVVPSETDWGVYTVLHLVTRVTTLEEDEAIATLLGAAPRMYLALRALFDARVMVHRFGGDADNTQAANAAEDAAREAIACAEGRTR